MISREMGQMNLRGISMSKLISFPTRPQCYQSWAEVGNFLEGSILQIGAELRLKTPIIAMHGI